MTCIQYLLCIIKGVTFKKYNFSSIFFSNDTHIFNKQNMPKIVSSSVVSSSDHANQNDQAKSLHVYYCLCSEFLLVIDADLRQLPRRRTDNSVIVSNTRRTYKLTAEADDCVLLKR